MRVSHDGRVHLALALAVLEPVVTDGTQPSLYIPWMKGSQPQLPGPAGRCYTVCVRATGLWLSGRASGSHPEGRRFESAQVHQKS